MSYKHLVYIFHSLIKSRCPEYINLTQNMPIYPTLEDVGVNAYGNTVSDSAPFLAVRITQDAI